jgi:hypothetical protein
MDEMVGVKIKNIRRMTQKEADEEGWDIVNQVAPVIELENGIIIYPSGDDEGNHIGMLFGRNGKKAFYVIPPE